jgi:AraC-like DNA-binding protein
MPRSTASAFSEPIDFQAALRDAGSLSLFVTAPGKFHARLTQVSLHSLRLSVVEENSARIGFLEVPANEVMMSFPLPNQPTPIWGGMAPRAGEFIIIGPGHRLHVRTEGPSRWGAIWLPEQDLANYFLELTGCTLKISPFAQVWRPPAAVDRHLLHLHGAAIRSAEARPNTIVSAEAAHGMEQQLIEGLVECLSKGRPDDQISTWRNQGIMARFEELLNARQERHLRVDELCVAIGVSARLLRLRCREALGMSPIGYVRLRALCAVHEILRNPGLEAANVSHIARCHGFRDLGRFAAIYRSLFGELPSATLRRTRTRKLLISRRTGGARLHEILQEP